MRRFSKAGEIFFQQIEAAVFFYEKFIAVIANFLESIKKMLKHVQHDKKRHCERSC